MDVVERYLLLGLRLGRHVDGFVDAYYGPAELAELAEREGQVAPAELAAEAHELASALEGLGDEQRRRWLGAQVEGLAAVAERLAGASLSYADEVRRCYGLELELPTEQELEAAHARIDELLPGPGPLAERFQAWRRAQELPGDALLPAVDALRVELRTRTAERFGLPEGEGVELELVHDEPWAAFNYYLGGLRSRVVVNTDLPVRAELVPDFAAHEIYPGHHTEHALKEEALVRARGFDEESIFLVGTPQSVVSEGIATNALRALGDEAERACAAILAERGVGYDVELSLAMRDAMLTLKRVPDTVADLIHERGAPIEEARDFYLRWSLRTPAEVDQSLQFVTHPTWRAYTVVYSAAERLVRRWAGDDPARFRRLLTEQMTTFDLR